MPDNDEILRAYSLLNALKENLPDIYEIEERWVKEYNNALAKITTATGMDLTDFKLSSDDLGESIASANSITGEVTYREGLYCERSRLIQKLDAILTYFTLLQTPPEKKIGFKMD